MSVVVSLLRAIDRADGEALVMHVGEKPYVVTATGHAELAANALTIPAMTGMLDQLLPVDTRQALEELGAVEYQLPAQPGFAPDARYSVVAARGGDDIWIEVRRKMAEAAPERQPQPAAAMAVSAAEAATYTLETSGPVAVEELASAPVGVLAPEPSVHLVATAPIPVTTPPPNPAHAQQVHAERAALMVDHSRSVDTEAVAEGDEPPVVTSDELRAITSEDLKAFGFDDPASFEFENPREPATEELRPTAEAFPRDMEEPVAAIADAPIAAIADAPIAVSADAPDTAVEERPVEDVEREPVAVAEEVDALAEDQIEEQPFEPATAEVTAVEADQPFETGVAPEEAVIAAATPTEEPEEDEEPEPPVPHLAPVVPIVPRVPVRVEPAPVPTVRGEGLPHLLQVAAAQGASVLYVAVQAKPSLRVDGEIRVLDQETPLSEPLLEAGLRAILPNGATVAVGEIETCDVAGVGRVQCLSFRDHRGLGAMFKMLPARAISSEQMGLGAPIQALCTETEGLVLVAGARGAGKSTLVAALVDQMNRTRRDHVVTVEQQIQFVHENRQSFVSQREARDEEEFAAAVRAALREGPDVLVIDQVASPEAATFALHAAANGHLVIASITSPTTTTAVSRFMEFFGEERAQARLTLGEHLRGVITQTLLRKTGGGRAAAREVLVNVPSVAALIADGQFDQLSSVLNGGRRVGMVPFNDALLALVQSGALDVREAYRKSPDQQELVSQLNRAGVDTTFAERLA